jgi:hypothetical protein
MPASFRKQQNIPPFEKGGSGGISIFYIPALSTTTRYIFSITASVSTIFQITRETSAGFVRQPYRSPKRETQTRFKQEEAKSLPDGRFFRLTGIWFS